MSTVVQVARAAGCKVDLAVTVRSPEIVVAAGDFRLFNQRFTLADSERFVVTFGGVDRTVHGYLVARLSDGEVRVLVETLTAESRSDRIPGAGQVRILHRLFVARIPGSATSLDGVEVKVYHYDVPETVPAMPAVQGTEDPSLRPDAQVGVFTVRAPRARRTPE